MALTDKEIQALQPREKRYKVTDGDGLYLLVNPAGGKYWYMKYYLGGRPQEVVFGVYPDVSLKLAREKRLDARQQLARGLNPRLEKKKMRRAASVLFERLAEEWLRMMSTPAKNGSDSAKAPLDPATMKRRSGLALCGVLPGNITAFAAGVILSMLVAMFNAWVLLVEIIR